MSERVRILLIDDNLVDRLAIRRAIEQSDLDAEIEEARTAAEALHKTSGTFDCWLLDHELPDMTGTELTRQLRNSGDLTPLASPTSCPRAMCRRAARRCGFASRSGSAAQKPSRRSR